MEKHEYKAKFASLDSKGVEFQSEVIETICTGKGHISQPDIQ